MGGQWKTAGAALAFSADTMLLLTDGSVMCQDSGTAHWWRLVPDASGGYSQGTWQQLSDGPNAPMYYASAVLRDGTVFVAGGELDNGKQADLCAAQLYDPQTDRWTALPTPAGWTALGDAACCVLPDGKVLVGSILDNRCAIFDPVNRSWSATGSKGNASSNEETWTLLADGSVLTADCLGHPATERYVGSAWVKSAPTPVELVEDASKEIGPAVLLPDGRVFAIGATGKTALFAPSANSTLPGTWAAGPSFPVENKLQLGAKDAPAVLLPNGRVLCAVGPVDGTADSYLGPTTFFEYDPEKGALDRLAEQPITEGKPPYCARLLLVPTGEVLFSNGGKFLQLYQPEGVAHPEWAPRISAVPATLTAGQSYRLTGLQLNGLSQACSYGDDVSMATNYPIVRMQTASLPHRVWYCRSFDHSTMAVATGQNAQFTSFTVPADLPVGAYSLCVIANGIPSAEHPVVVSAPAAVSQASPAVTASASRRLLTNGASFVSSFYRRLTNANERITQDVRSFFIWFLVAGGVWTLIEAAAGALVDHSCSTFLRLLATEGLLSAASLISGGVLGFLFGIPRSLSSSAQIAQPGGASEAADARPTVQPNTNLEQISDWLTKILVGVGLTQLVQIQKLLDYTAAALGPAFKPLPAGSLIGVLIVVAFGFGGFFWAYFESRTSLMRVFGDDS